MKKLIVLFLLVCAGGIYFFGSSCFDALDEHKSPDEMGCSFLSVPVVDFTTSKTEYLVGDPVTFTFTGTTGQKDDKNVQWEWHFPGTKTGDGVAIYARNPVVTYIAAGTYTVSVKVYNRCWNNFKYKFDYITIKAK